MIHRANMKINSSYEIFTLELHLQRLLRLTYFYKFFFLIIVDRSSHLPLDYTSKIYQVNLFDLVKQKGNVKQKYIPQNFKYEE